jgi:hypothetical protein
MAKSMPKGKYTGLIYTGPTGSAHSVRDADEVIAILDATDAAYWKRGSGDAGLVFENDPLRRELVIMCRKPWGYHFLYSQDTGSTPSRRVRGFGQNDP